VTAKESMRIAIHSSLTNRGTIDKIVAEARKTADFGLSGYWAPMLNGHDTLTVLALAGREAAGIELGTAVVPIPLRPVYALAQQVTTVQEAIGGRLALGLGPSHEALVRDLFGLEWTPPLPTTRRYVEELTAILAGTADRRVVVGTGAPTRVLFGAVNPAMARLAGQLASGVITWASGLTTVTDVIKPAVAAARAADQQPEDNEDNKERVPPFRIVTALPFCVTDDEAAARAHVDRLLGANDALPSYQKVLRREGVKGVAELAVVGSPKAVREQLRTFAEAGVTDFAAHVVAATPRDRDRTWDLLGSHAVEAGR
jgi:F420-dependent oxidoreductase-like protein